MTTEINWSEVDLLDFDNQRIYLTNDIKNRDNYAICILGDLDKNRIYDLNIKYNIEKVREHKVRGLNYEQLRSEIFSNLIAPSNLLMKIFVAPSKRGKE